MLIGPIEREGCVELEAGFPMGLDEVVFLDGPDREIPIAFGDARQICAQIRPAVP